MGQIINNLPAMWETWVQSLELRRSPGEGNGNPLQYSCLENLMDRGAWWVTVHGVTKVGHDLATEHQQQLLLMLRSWAILHYTNSISIATCFTCRYQTFPSSQKVLLDNIITGNILFLSNNLLVHIVGTGLIICISISG